MVNAVLSHLAVQLRQREHERVATRAVIHVGDLITGVTRDISPSGVYFLIDERLPAEQAIRFSIDFEDPTNAETRLCLECVGQIVRREEVEGRCGIAVAITESHLERRPAHE